MNSRVIIVGGGWSGLAAAVELAANGLAPTVLEAARQPGGRARAAPMGDTAVDNGQHLLIGAYRETLRLLALMSVREGDAFRRKPLRLEVLGEGRRLSLGSAALPAPLHLLSGLATAKGLGWRERMAALRFGRLLYGDRGLLERDLSVSKLLERGGQPPALTELLWKPICLGALNTPPEEASAHLFLRVLRDTFTRRRSDSDLLFPRKNLGALLPLPAMEYVERLGGSIRLGQRVQELQLSGGRITGVRTGDQSLAADHVVLATSARAACRLLHPHRELQRLAQDIARLAHRPIATVYLQYPPQVRLASGMLGFTGSPVQWVIDRRHCAQPGLLAAVVGGEESLEWPRQRLADGVTNELAARFPSWPRPMSAHVLRERHATLHAVVDCTKYRPGAQSGVRGCWIAGDFTDTGYPATLEGAVRSGVQCARLILEQRAPA
jgi:squalene-associated FAD-dependent desaturase